MNVTADAPVNSAVSWLAQLKMVNAEIAKLIQETRSQSFEAPSNALASIAMLLERISISRKLDTAYQSLLPDSLYRLRLSASDTEALIQTATEALQSDTRITQCAAWALGKTYSIQVVPELIASLRHWRQHDDLTVYNLLRAIENCGGVEPARTLIEEISQSECDKPNSMAFAQKTIARNDG